MTHFYRSVQAQAAVEAQYGELLGQWPIACEQKHVATREGETFVLVCGPETAPPVFLMHGSVGNTIMWMRTIKQYAEHFRCYVLDMIGEPGFSAPSRPDMTSDAHALWLDDVLDALGLDAVAMVGVSLGGWLATDYAARRPERVTAIAAIGPGGIGRQKNFFLKALPLFFLGAYGKQRIRESVFGPPPENLPENAQKIGQFMQLVMNSFRARIVKLPILSDAQLQALKPPLYVILGGKDVLIDSGETRRRLETFVPSARIDYIPDGRHYMIERDTATPIIDFLTTVFEGRV